MGQKSNASIIPAGCIQNQNSFQKEILSCHRPRIRAGTVSSKIHRGRWPTRPSRDGGCTGNENPRPDQNFLAELPGTSGIIWTAKLLTLV